MGEAGKSTTGMQKASSVIATLRSQQGQAVILTVSVLSVLAAMVIYLLASYVTKLGRQHGRVRDSMFAHAAVESIGVRLRRAFDLADLEGAGCGAPSRPLVGTPMNMGAYVLCLPPGNEICVPHPSDPTRQFCARFNLFIAKRDSVEPVLEARLELPTEPATEDFVRGAKVVLGWPVAVFKELMPIPSARAQRSELNRPPIPPAGSTANALPPVPPVNANGLGAVSIPLAMTCGLATGATPGSRVTHCLTVRVCDTRYPCSDPMDFIYQRYAFQKVIE